MKKDKLEKKVSELLELVTAKGIRELYEDAKSVLDCDNLRAPEKAIGNYLREIESALFSVTVSIAKLDTDIIQHPICSVITSGKKDSLKPWAQ